MFFNKRNGFHRIAAGAGQFQGFYAGNVLFQDFSCQRLIINDEAMYFVMVQHTDLVGVLPVPSSIRLRFLWIV